MSEQAIAVMGTRGPAKELPEGGVRLAIEIDNSHRAFFLTAFPGVGHPIVIRKTIGGTEAVKGVRRPVREGLDGALRVTVDVLPEYRDAFFADFKLVGESVVMAAERVGATEPVARVGRNCRLAGEMCRNLAFRTYASYAQTGAFIPTDEAEAADFVRRECDVASRRDLDASPVASDRFNALIQRFMRWAREHNMETLG